MQYVAKTV